MNKQKDSVKDTTCIIEDHLTEFQPFLDDTNMPEDQRQEFLALLWSIMIEFAALGFGADAASQAIAAQLSQASTIEPPEAGRLPLTQAFNAVQPEAKTNNENEVTGV